MTERIHIDGDLAASRDVLDTHQLGRRAAPFLIAIAMAYALLPFQTDVVDWSRLMAGTAILAAIIAAAVLIARLGDRAPLWTLRLLPFVYLVFVVVLRDAFGGPLSGAGSLVFLAPFWVGLHDTRLQVLIVIAAMFVALASGGPDLYDGQSIRRAIILTAIIGFISLAVQRAVAESRVIRRRDEQAAASRAETNERLAETNALLERSNRELEQFAYVSSHDLQEPLRMIRSFSQLFMQRHGAKLDAEGTELIGYVIDGAERAQRLVQDLLDYSRVGTAELELTPVELDDSLDRALQSLQAFVEETGATIERAGPLPTVVGDASQLDRLFANLLANSMRYRHPDRAPHVVVTGRQLDDGVEVQVRDNGIGFDQEHAERIFLMFQRLHGRAKYDGTGIGLAICTRIVERHGGRISATGEPDVGSTFTFTIGASE
ncbi:MAG: Sensor protein [Thermoleophilia bacterium]|nr:Sensor protein [Thermoleophilia bacterium]